MSATCTLILQAKSQYLVNEYRHYMNQIDICYHGLPTVEVGLIIISSCFLIIVNLTSPFPSLFNLSVFIHAASSQYIFLCHSFLSIRFVQSSLHMLPNQPLVFCTHHVSKSFLMWTF